MAGSANDNVSMETPAIYCLCGEKSDHLYETIEHREPPALVYEEIQERSLAQDFGPDSLCSEQWNRRSSDVHEIFIPQVTTKCGLPVWVKLILLLLFVVMLVSGAYFYYLVGHHSSSVADVAKDPDDTSTSSDISNGKCDTSNDYYAEGWYTALPRKVNYTCARHELVSIIFVQQLQVPGEHCDDRTTCLSLITSYLEATDTYAKFSFYIDNNTNVYGGRGWLCPFSTSEVWVAVMVDGFSPNTAVRERERLLYHFNNEIATYGMQCHHYENYLIINYLNVSCI